MEPLHPPYDDDDSFDLNSCAPDFGPSPVTQVHLAQILQDGQVPETSPNVSYLDHSALSPGPANMFDGVPVQNS